METTHQRSQRSQQSQEQQKYQDALRTSIEKAIDLALLMEDVQKYDCLYNKFSKEYRDTWGTRKSTAESNRREIRLKSLKGVLCLSRRLLRRKTPIIVRKHASSRSRRFAASMLNLRNGANYGPLGLHSAIAAIIWKPSIAAIAEPFLSAIVAIIWKPGFTPFFPARINTSRSVFALFHSFYIKLILCPH